MGVHARKRGPLAPLFAGLVTLVTVSSERASAQPSEGGAAPSRALDVTIIGGEEDAGRLMDTIRELVGRLGLTVVPHEVTAADAHASAGPPPAGLQVTVDLASRYEVLTSVRNGPTEVRRTIPRDASPAIVREEIGEAVRSAVEAQLYADDLPRAPPAAPVSPPPSPPAPPPPPPPYHGLAVDVTTLAGAGAVADTASAATSGASTRRPVVAHVGGGVVVGLRSALRPAVTVTAEYVFPFNATVPGVTAQADIVALRAVPSLEVLHASWIAVDLGAGLGVDVVSLKVTPTPLAMYTVSTQSVPPYVDPILTARARAYVALGADAAFTVIATGDFDLLPPRYSAGGGELLSLWTVRPTVLAGFTFTAFGGGLFGRGSP
jgi:hypothetical protein